MRVLFCPFNRQNLMASPTTSVNDLLQERTKFDRRMVTVMFTDIAGSTRYFDQHGDLAGMAMLESVNGRLQPLVRSHKGTIVKTIGDAILAYFDAPVEAVRCSIAMQRAMEEFNRQGGGAYEQILVRVALNLGMGLLKDNDVFGDVVNVCSRIEHATEGGKIGVSPSVVEATRREEDLVFRKLGTVRMRGKARQMDLFELLWRQVGKVKKPPPQKVSGEQLALATGTRLGLEEEVRAAIAEVVKGKTKTTIIPAIEKKEFTLVELRPDRTLGKRFPLKGDSAIIGREKADITFPDDPLMSRQHAAFITLGGALYVEDLGSSNGTFVRIRKPHPLQHEDVLWLGRQMFRYRRLSSQLAADTEQKAPQTAATKIEAPSAPGTEASREPLAELIRLLKEGKEEKHFPLYRGQTTFGRTQGTYTFPDDPYFSRLHARINLHGARCMLEDLNSTNGTFVRISGRHLLDEDDTVLIGGQLLQVVAETLEKR